MKEQGAKAVRKLGEAFTNVVRRKSSAKDMERRPGEMVELRILIFWSLLICSVQCSDLIWVRCSEQKTGMK